MKAKVSENEMRYKIVGKFLKGAREEAELTQGEVAKSLAYSTAQFVSNWERGLAMPPLNVLPKLARILEVPPKRMINTLNKYQEELLKLQKREVADLFGKRA